MKRKSNAIALFTVALGAVSIGCGGSDSASTASTVGAGTTQVVGPFTIHNSSSSAVKPTGIGAGSILVYTLSGANFTNVAYTPARVLANTRLAFAQSQGQIFTAFFQSGASRYQVTSDLKIGGNASMSWSPSASAIVFQGDQGDGLGLYTIGADGSNLVKLRSSLNLTTPRWSPDGSKIAFSEFDSVSNHSQIFTIPYNGGTPTRVSDGTSEDSYPTWSPDASKLAFIRSGDLYTMNANGTNALVAFSGPTLQNVSWSPDGTRFAVQFYDGTRHQVGVVTLSGVLFPLTTTDENLAPTWSPDSKFIAYNSVLGPNSFTVTMDNSGQNKALIQLGSVQPAWSPYPSRRAMIGSGAGFGATASGLIFSQLGDNVASFISFGAVNPATTTITSNAVGGQNVGFQISGGGGINSLKYTNNPLTPPTTVIPLGPTASAQGVLLSMNNVDGHISLVAPFVRSQKVQSPTGTLKYVGKFLAAYDSLGKNLAPQGATSITVEEKTGAPLSVHS